jgi:hypothetical protein
MSVKQSKALYRVRFMTKEDNKPVEIVVKRVASSEFLGLIMLEDFVFSDTQQHVLLPSEERARRQYADTKRLHVPYHNILSIEEFHANRLDLKKFPFLRTAEEESHHSNL